VRKDLGKGEFAMNSRPSSYLLLLIATLGLAGCGGNGTTPIKSVVSSVYVLDSYNASAEVHRVEVFDVKGNYLSQFSHSFDIPHAIAIDPQGNVYVKDGNLHCSVDKFDSKGNFLLQIGSCGVPLGGNDPGIFDNSGSLATDASGNLWVTSPDFYSMQEFDSSGNFLKMVCMANIGVNNCPMATAQQELPTDIALDAKGNIYVATDTTFSAMPNTILKFDSSGNYVTSIGAAGGGNGQFSSPTGIAFDAKGDLYVVDSGNGRVQKFDGQGNYLSQFGSEGNGAGQFAGAPGAISIDVSGNIYVADYYGYRVLVFDGKGNYLRQFGTYGNGNGQFTGVLGVAVSR
jgi:tripartite motif-containing protein 71